MGFSYKLCFMTSDDSCSPACLRGGKKCGKIQVQEAVAEDQHHEGICGAELRCFNALETPMSLPFFLQPVPAQVPPSPSRLPQKLVGLLYFFHLLKLHLRDNSPCFKMRIEIAGPCSLEGFLPICYTLPCSVLTLPSLIQFLGKLCGPPCSFFFAPTVNLTPTAIQAGLILVA